ncbi:glycyl radical protein [Clostridium sp. AF19-22AC]|jgi:pyruvate formate-lyase/glycerol dehydratase family glycyl radical enzyme|uniref:Formate C-acetyltransferase n=1 Tax=Faecalicatena orotica TaxID=1544 RepID=A0A2Y9C9Q8_9FIRM|nr:MULTISPECIES: trans-4-hydroxy-L-proline dehydratase [Clostridia]PWJ31491.1 formate C-acetyltransferase [Faecalicatena orotica]RHR25063.1 glycyl radical protein [Clostridium sp. AF19-22AC]SSA54698.1 formate C-acetyltransferase [Faecalicatena orotica]
MEERGMNERIKKLRKLSLDTPAHIDLERALSETETYKKYEGELSVPELRGQVLKDYFSNKTLYIGEGELIVGEKGDSPQAAPTFPELCCHTVEDMHVMNDRDLINFKVKEEDYKIQEDVMIPYWDKRSMRNKILRQMTPEWKDAYEAGIFTEFMEQRGPGHTVGSVKIYEKGFLDYKEDIQKSIDSLDFMNDPEALDKKNELEGMKLACDAIMILGERYAAYARELAEKETDAKRKEELLQIAVNCDVVPAHKPETYWQAIQMYWFVHLGVTSELNPWDAYSPGRLDQHLNPFYEKDTEAGIMDDDRALELLECLWVKFNNQPAPPKVGITLKESSTYTDFANLNTGGITPNGENGVNNVSYLILDCMDEMKLLQPSSNVQISRKTPQKFLKRACEISRKGWGQPAFYNTEAIVQELLNAGKSLEDARRGGTSGCVETGAFGNEAYILTGYFNIPKVFELTLNNGFDKMTGKQLGLKLGNAVDFKSYEELFEAFQKQMKYFIDIKVQGSNVIEKIYAENMPVPFLSIITNDCISKGKDYNGGGARYNTKYLQGVGIGTITDCLAAVKYNVYDQKTFTMEELMKALDDNFEGHDRIANLVRNKTPKYGNDDDYADDIMRSVFEYYRSQVTGRPNMLGGMYRINMLPTTCHVYFGDVMMASANGRLAHKPVSEGISPEKGADTNGPTAVVKSCAKMDHLQTGGTLLNQKFTPSVVAGEEGLEQMANLVRAYFNMDGHHIQFNVIDKETLIQAQKHPEDYKDLIVRVAGYSDHFRNLSKALQDEIIERTEQSFN